MWEKRVTPDTQEERSWCLKWEGSTLEHVSLFSLYVWFLCLGMPRELLQPCVDWLAPFMDALEDFGTVTRKVFPTVRKEDQYNIQANLDYMSILVSVIFFL